MNLGTLNFVFLVVMLACSFGGLPAHAALVRAADFALYDQNGDFFQLSRLQEDTLLLIVSQANKDDISRKVLKEANDLSIKYKELKLFVVGLNATDTAREEIKYEINSQDLKTPILIDSAGIVTSTLKSDKTGEVFLIKPKGFELLYRGPLHSPGDNEGGLENILLKVITGNFTETETSPYNDGKAINNVQMSRINARDISYQNDIAPILLKRCASCHIEDGLAPWAMSSHRMIQGWSPMIREVLITRRMPPGQIDMEIGDWQDIHYITDEEISLLVGWIDAGARKSAEDLDPLSTPRSSNFDWPDGAPDLIVDLPENKVPATGIVDFIYSRVPLNIDKDRWLRAVAYKVDGASVLHSLVVNSVEKQQENSSANNGAATSSEFISLYVPGRTMDSFPNGVGMLLKKDKDLLVKTRYLSSGRATTDKSQLGLYFLESKPAQTIYSLTMENTDFLVPVNEANFQIDTLSAPLAFDAQIESISPLMHSRGKSVALSIMQTNGVPKKIFSMPNYNYNWQMSYRFSTPLNIKNGSSFYITTIYDNSVSNPLNLDPESEAKSGPTGLDETLTHYIRLIVNHP